MNFEIQFPTHAIENNDESQRQLNEHNVHFSNKCKSLLILLCTGERYTFADVITTIGDLSRRALDLITMNGGTVASPTIPVQRTFKKDSRVKEYWLKPEDIDWIKIKYAEYIK